MIALVVSLQVVPGRLEEFTAAIRENAERSFTDEPGTWITEEDVRRVAQKYLDPSKISPGIMTPGRALLTPASQDPLWFVSWPFTKLSTSSPKFRASNPPLIWRRGFRHATAQEHRAAMDHHCARLCADRGAIAAPPPDMVR